MPSKFKPISIIIPFTIICTKSDKFAKTRIKPAVKAIADRLALGEDNLIAVSNENSYGKEKVLMRLDKIMEAYAISNEVSLEEDSQEESEGEDE